MNLSNFAKMVIFCGPIINWWKYEFESSHRKGFCLISANIFQRIIFWTNRKFVTKKLRSTFTVIHRLRSSRLGFSHKRQMLNDSQKEKKERICFVFGIIIKRIENYPKKTELNLPFTVEYDFIWTTAFERTCVCMCVHVYIFARTRSCIFWIRAHFFFSSKLLTFIVVVVVVFFLPSSPYSTYFFYSNMILFRRRSRSRSRSCRFVRCLRLCCRCRHFFFSFVRVFRFNSSEIYKKKMERQKHTRSNTYTEEKRWRLQNELKNETNSHTHAKAHVRKAPPTIHKIV